MILESQEGAILTVHLQPKASHTDIVGVHGEALKIRVAAPPIAGAANDALCAFLAKSLQIPQASVVIKRGITGRRKQVLLKNITPDRLREVLARMSPQ